MAVRVDKENILIGEQFQLIIAATMPSSSNAGTLRIDSIPHFEILQAKIDTQQSGRDNIYQHTLTLTSWDSGRWNIPPFAVPGSNRTKPIPITVSFSSPFNPEQEYHDVKDIMEVPKPERETWFWYLIGLLLLILLFLLLFPPNKKKDKGVFAPDATIY
ncbi:MAG TPA: BatD family protein, partial [Flavisolibacter sp.]|nr:BatD family protein [Flavisolibacter sp.]